MSAFRSFRLLILLFLMFWKTGGSSAGVFLGGESEAGSWVLSWLADSPEDLVLPGMTMALLHTCLYSGSPGVPEGCWVDSPLDPSSGPKQSVEMLELPFQAAVVHRQSGEGGDWRRSEVGIAGCGIFAFQNRTGAEE